MEAHHGVVVSDPRMDITVSSDLLLIAEMDPSRKKKGKAVPLIMEFVVNPDTGPFLVSKSSRSVMWVNPHAGRVRAGVRKIVPGTLFNEVVAAVAKLGTEAEWGNVHPFTGAGLVNAIAHLRSYDLSEIEILIHPQTSLDAGFPPIMLSEDREPTLLGFPVMYAEWLDLTTIVVVPHERDFVGFLLQIDAAGTAVAVIHNASRGIGICRDAPRP